MSVTAVPLRPIQKGSVARLWLGIVLVLAVAGLLAWNGLRSFGKTEDGVAYTIFAPGEGDHPSKDDFALVSYKGTLPDGTVFDQQASAPMDLSTMLPAFAEAVTMLGKGGHIRAYLPAKAAYGETPPQGSPIPPNSPLIFDVTLLEFRSRAEIMEMQRQMQMQQMMQQQMGGAPQGMPAPDGAPGAAN